MEVGPTVATCVGVMDGRKKGDGVLVNDGVMDGRRVGLDVLVGVGVIVGRGVNRMVNNDCESGVQKAMIASTATRIVNKKKEKNTHQP